MKKSILKGVLSHLWFKPFAVLIVIILTFNDLYAQVHFTQTTDENFNLGVLNSVLVSGGSVILQNQASDAGNWLTTTALPQSLAGHKTVVWNNRYVYMVGGQSNSGYSNSVYYSGINSSGVTGWSQLNSLPVGMKDAAVVIGTNTIYVVGGRNATQVYNTVYYASINYDGTIGAWQTSSVNLPNPLWGHTAAYLNGYLYVVGGTSSLTENSAVNDVFFTKVKADNSLGVFNSGADLPALRNKHSMVTYDSKLYVFGGYSNTGTRANSVYFVAPAADGSTGSWSTGTPLPVAISNHSTVLANGLIVVMSGATNGGLSNTVYYTSIDQPFPWTWTTSPYSLYDLTKDGSGFAANGIVVHTGGTNLSGGAIVNSRYAGLILTSNYINKGTFVSNPFLELGADRIIDSLTWHATYNPAFANCQISYRTAHSNGEWTNWNSFSTNSPILLGDTTQYLQYYVMLSSQSTNNVQFNYFTLSTRGSQLSGNLNTISTFTKAKSPYWVTSDISFTGGTHTFEAGATILFLPQTGMYVGQANIICSGNITDSVKFLYYTNGSGLWKGLRFDPNSDNGVSSQFNYTVIADAGFGWSGVGWTKANLVCEQTNEPYLQNCYIRNSTLNGISLVSSNLIIQNTTIARNDNDGIYLENSNPTFVSCHLSYNGGAGVYITSIESNPTYSASIIDHNLYGIHYPSPNFSFTQPLGSPVLLNNSFNGIVLNGGDINGTNKVWSSIDCDIILLGTLRIVQYGSTVRLTIEPGNTIKALPGVQIQVGGDWPYSGDLYAIGSANNMITFSSHNEQSGGWNGILFRDYSDNWGGHSQLAYCIIEKGAEYNYFAESTIQPDLVDNCIIRNALVDGARYSNSSGTITNCEFSNNGRYPLYLIDAGADPTHSNNTYSGNGINKIVMSGRNYSSNKTINNEGIPYLIQGDFGFYSNSSTTPTILSIDPGTTLEFAKGKFFNGWNNGVLIAVGNADSLIVFKSSSDSIGGWGGIHFSGIGDNGAGSSSMKYCKIEQGTNYNIYYESSNQPALEHCIITKSASHGIVEQNSSASIQHCQFLDNSGYPLKYNDWNCNSFLKKNFYSGNNPNYICLSGGDYYNSRTLYFDSIPYRITGSIRIVYNNPRITIKPGVTLAFDKGTYIRIGEGWDWGGSLWAEGSSDSLITFKSYNDSIGGWSGIFFHDGSDYNGATSSLKYCKIEKAANNNLYSENSNQPFMKHCEFSESGGSNIQLSSSSPVIDSCLIQNAGLDGIILWSSTSSIHGCQFMNNGRYPLYLADANANPSFTWNYYSNNVNNRIGYAGRDFNDNRTLFNPGIPYHSLGDLRIMKANSNARLTIQPGVVLEFATGKKLQVGGSQCCWADYGGELFAVGTPDSLIKFKPFNDSIGGWSGILFADQNDNYGGTSYLKYCKIEKASEYNLRCESSNKPTISHCEFSESGGSNIQLTSSSPSIDTCTIHDSGLDGLILWNSSSSIRGCQFLNNGRYPLYLADANANPEFSRNYYSNNVNNRIGYAGRDFNLSRTLINPGIPYHILGDIKIQQHYNSPLPVLTIMPGTTMEFAKDKRLLIAPDCGCYHGSIFAEGKPDSLIVFKPFNDSIAGWGGISFYDGNDNWGGTSSMKYCRIEKANYQNLYCESSSQPTVTNCLFSQSGGYGIYTNSANPTIKNCLIDQSNSSGLFFLNHSPTLDSCSIINSNADGILLQNSSSSITNCTIANNSGYPIKMVDWQNCNNYLNNNHYSNNSPDFIYISGGDFSGNKTIYNDGIPYRCAGDMRLVGGPRLTIQKGVTLAFNPDVKIRLGEYGWNGSLWAEGNKDSIIIFKPYNNTIGGWGGLYFYDGSDNSGAVSLLKHCNIQKAQNQNIYCEWTSQPLIDHCYISNSAGDGLKLYYSSIQVRSTTLTANTTNGISIEGYNIPTIGNSSLYSCNLFYNGNYNVYNNTGYDIPARYNFWASRDSVKIKSKIWDKDDNPALGRVWIEPFIDLPALHTDSMQLEGSVKYANNYLTPMNNAKMKLKNAGVTFDSTNTIASGWYAFEPVASGCYNLTSSPAQNWAGVNATDALLILNHTVHISMLTGMKLAAADMNQSNTVNSNDALFAMNRFTGNISSFPSGDTFMEIDTIIIDSSHVTNNLKMLWFGDVNSSYVPVGKSHEATITFAEGGFITVPSFTEFNLPVRIQKGTEIGAISFGLYYPPEFFEIVGVGMVENRENFQWSAKDGLFRFAWSDLISINPDDKDILISIKMRSLELSGLQENFTFTLYEACEIANKAGEVIPDVQLEIPGIRSKAIGIGDTENRYSLSIHPNPFTEQTTIELTLFAGSSVSYTLCDLFGNQVKSMNSVNLEPGTHKMNLYRDQLAPGIYLLRVNISTNDILSSRIIKVVVSK